MWRASIALLLLAASSTSALKLERASAAHNDLDSDIEAAACDTECIHEKACCASLDENFSGATTRYGVLDNQIETTQTWGWRGRRCRLNDKPIPNQETACNTLEAECEDFHASGGCALKYTPAYQRVGSDIGNSCVCTCKAVTCPGGKVKQSNSFKCVAKDCQERCCETKCKDAGVSCAAGTSYDSSKDNTGCHGEGCKVTCCGRTKETVCKELQAKNIYVRWDSGSSKCYQESGSSESEVDPFTIESTTAAQCFTVGNDVTRTTNYLGTPVTVSRTGKNKCRSNEVFKVSNKFGSCTEKGCCDYDLSFSLESCCQMLANEGKAFEWKPKNGKCKQTLSGGSKVDVSAVQACNEIHKFYTTPAAGDYTRPGHKYSCGASFTGGKFEKVTECCERKTCGNSQAATAANGCEVVWSNDKTYDSSKASVQCDDDSPNGDCYKTCCKKTTKACCDEGSAINGKWRYGGGLGKEDPCWSGQLSKVWTDGGGNSMCGSYVAESTSQTTLEGCKTFCKGESGVTALEWMNHAGSTHCGCLACSWEKRAPGYVRANYVGFTYDQMCDGAKCNDHYNGALSCNNPSACWQKNDDGVEHGVADVCAEAKNLKHTCKTVKDSCPADTHVYSGNDLTECSSEIECKNECCRQKDCSDQSSITCAVGTSNLVTPGFSIACKDKAECEKKCCGTCSVNAKEADCKPTQCPGFFWSYGIGKCRDCTKDVTEADCGKPLCPGHVWYDGQCKKSTATLQCHKQGNIPSHLKGACKQIVSMLNGIGDMPSPVDKVFILAKVLLEYLAGVE